MKSRSLFEKMIAACLVLVVIPISLAARSRVAVVTEPPEPDLRLSALIGLSRGEAASLNVTNSSRQAREVRFFFLDINGRPLKSSTQRILPGQSLSLSLSHGEMRDPAWRLQFRGLVQVIADPPDPDAEPPNPDADPPDPDLVMSSLEVFDEVTGRTSYGLLLPAVRSAQAYLPFLDTARVRLEQ